MPRKMWVYDSQSGGVKIPQKIQPRLRQRILEHAKKHYAGKYNRIEVRFRGHCSKNRLFVAGEPFQCVDSKPAVGDVS